MRALTILAIITIFLSSCQQEIFYETKPADNQTDTSVVLRKKTIYHLGFGEDSVLTVYKRNKINGVKGYIISDTGYTLGYRSKAEFKYNTAGHLTDIIQNANAPITPFNNVKKFTWDGDMLKHIYWTENGTIRMNRAFDYFETRDSLFIEYDLNSGSAGIMDSTHVVNICDTAMKKMYGIFMSGLYDNPQSGTQFGHVKQINYNYSGNNLMSSKFYGEDFNTGPNRLYNHGIDSAVLHFSRENQAGSFLNDLETDLFGKELRILAYNHLDSVSWWFDDFFNYGNTNQTFLSNAPFFFMNIYTWAYKPMTTTNIDYVKYHDGVEIERKTALPLKKQVYSLDTQFRIKSIKEYDSHTNQLLVETYFYYP